LGRIEIAGLHQAAGFKRPFQGRPVGGQGRVVGQGLQQQFGGVGLRPQRAALDDGAVPDAVHVAAFTVQVHLVVVAALVVAHAGVHRLVQVADEVHDPLQRSGARGVVLVAVGQDAEHQVGLGNHAVVARTVLRRLETAAAIEVDVVPLGGAFGDYGVGVAQFVGPGGDAGQGRVGLGGERAVDLGAGRGREAGLGDAGDDAVA